MQKYNKNCINSDHRYEKHLNVAIAELMEASSASTDKTHVENLHEKWKIVTGVLAEGLENNHKYVLHQYFLNDAFLIKNASYWSNKLNNTAYKHLICL